MIRRLSRRGMNLKLHASQGELILVVEQNGRQLFRALAPRPNHLGRLRVNKLRDSHIVNPLPDPFARVRARCAAATSSTARPNDLKIVTSSGDVRAQAVSPNSATMWESPKGITSPDSLRAAARESTKTRDRATSAGSISCSVGRVAPTETTCVPGATQSLNKIGVCEDAAITITSAPRTADSADSVAIAPVSFANASRFFLVGLQARTSRNL